MGQDALIALAKSGFADSFGTPPDAVAYAPGRVNLLGEHTDYNGGFVLPMPLRLGTAVALGHGGAEGTVEIVSTSFDGKVTRRFADDPDKSWTTPVLGSLVYLLKDAPKGAGLQVMVTTNLPVRSGLSSSAAVQVATMRAAREMFGIAIDDVGIAKLARKAENEFVGVPCGIMDQYSVSVGQPGNAVFLDTRNIVSENAPLPDTHQFAIVYSGVTHDNNAEDHGTGSYSQRVAECHAACAALGVTTLSDLSVADMEKINALPAPLDGRARHIVTENKRVQDAVAALKAGDTDAFAALMIASHASQRDDYAVSVPQVDALVAGALAAGATGARLTGGGFGGSIVALIANEKVDAWCDAITAAFPDARVVAVT